MNEIMKYEVKSFNSIKVCCIHCCKEMYINYINNHFKNCKMKDLIINEEKVVCQICFGRFKEINNFHLNTHNINAEEYDKLFPGFERLSNESKRKKDNFTGKMSKELSDKLKYSHTLEGYIEKYGKEDGERRYNLRSENFSKSRTLEGYIEKYGELEGTNRYNEKCLNIGISSKKRWSENYENLKKSRTLEGYIEKYGEDEGIERWFEKNSKNSSSSSLIDKSLLDDWEKYCKNIDRITKATLSKYTLENIDKRGRKDGYDLDHKISKVYGFNNNISPYIMGSIYNLEIIKTFDNISKLDKCSINLEDIIDEFNSDDFYKKLIKEDVLNKYRIIY